MQDFLMYNGEMQRELAVYDPADVRGARVEGSTRGDRRHCAGLANATMRPRMSAQERALLEAHSAR